MSITILTSCHVIWLHNHNSRHDLRSLINGLLSYPDFARVTLISLTKLRYTRKFLRVFARTGCISAVLLPILFVYAVHWNNPCSPDIAGFWIIPECIPMQLTNESVHVIAKFGSFVYSWLNIGLSLSLSPVEHCLFLESA